MFLDVVEDRFQLHPVCPGDVLSVVTQIVTAGSQDAFLLSKDSLSPFRHRLRIALTPAVAIEGDGGRGDTLLPNLSAAHLQTILTHPQKLVTNPKDTALNLGRCDYCCQRHVAWTKQRKRYSYIQFTR